jgi:hypothetical protein
MAAFGCSLRPWSRADKLTALTVFVAVIACASAFFIPEVRQFFGLEKPTAPALSTVTQIETTPPPSASQTAPETTPDATKSKPSKKPTTKPVPPQIEQRGTGNGAAGSIDQSGNCNINQIGGSGNQATANCAPQQRHLSEDQKTKLASLLKAAAPQELYFVSAPDAETTYFSSEILSVLASAGWQVVPHPPNWGTIERQGQGLFIMVADVNKVPRGAAVLQQALKQIGIEATGQTFVMVPTDKFGIYLGVKPAPPNH